MNFKSIEITHQGNVRKNNEDYYVYTSIDENNHLFMVADGMGGLQAGEIASQIACQTVASYFIMQKQKELIEDSFKNSIEIANEKIYNYGKSNNLKSIGTTAVILFFEKEKAYYAHIGDSRLYLLEKQSLTQLTKDHSYIQYLLDQNQITPQQAKTHPKRSLVTRAIGVEPTPNPSICEQTIEITKGQFFLLCTDGLFNSLENETIQDILLKNIDIEQKANDLLSKSLELGGADNITFILIEIL